VYSVSSLKVQMLGTLLLLLLFLLLLFLLLLLSLSLLLLLCSTGRGPPIGRAKSD